MKKYLYRIWLKQNAIEESVKSPERETSVSDG